MKLVTLICERQCSRLYNIPAGLKRCGKFLQVFRGGILQLVNEYYILDHGFLGHVIYFPEDIGEHENIMVSGVVE